MSAHTDTPTLERNTMQCQPTQTLPPQNGTPCSVSPRRHSYLRSSSTTLRSIIMISMLTHGHTHTHTHTHTRTQYSFSFAVFANINGQRGNCQICACPILNILTLQKIWDFHDVCVCVVVCVQDSGRNIIKSGLCLVDHCPVEPAHCSCVKLQGW